MSIAIKLDPSYIDAYFLKGTSSYLVGESSDAFISFQDMIKIENKN